MKLIICLLAVIMLLGFASSWTITLETRDVAVGEKVSFGYTFLSDKDEKIVYTPMVKCVEAYSPMLELKSLNLKKDVPVTLTYDGESIDENTTLQQCLARIKVESPFIQVKEKEFDMGTLNKIAFEIQTCKDSICNEQSKVFVTGDRVYVKIFSGEEINVAGKLMHPDGDSEKLNFPTSFKASASGSYSIEAEAFKEGYKNETRQVDISVSPEESKIQNVDLSKPDVLSIELTGSANSAGSSRWVYIIVAAVILILLVLVIWVIKRRG